MLDANGQSIVSVYGRETRVDADTGPPLSMDEARDIATNIAMVPTVLALKDVFRILSESPCLRLWHPHCSCPGGARDQLVSRRVRGWGQGFGAQASN